MRPGGGTPRKEVLRNQRERLFGATIAVVSEKGYEATTVADLVDLAGVSRSDFYEHFSGKEACVLATVEALIEPTIAAISRVKAASGERRAREIFEALIELIVAQAPTSRLCFVELHAAGAEAERVFDQAFDAFEGVMREGFAEMPGRAQMPPEIVRAVVGGLRKIIHTRLYRGEEEALLSAVPELWSWGLSYYPPPEPLRPGRASGGEPGQFRGYTQAEWIARAVAETIAKKGYQATRTDDIAAHAGISLATYYAHYANKQEGLLAALEMGGSQLMALAAPAARRAPDWRDGGRAAYEAIFSFLAAEPAFAQLAAVEVYTAGPEALARRDRMMDGLATMLAPAYRENPKTPPIAAEAIGGAVYSLLRDKIRKDGAERLHEVTPLATYLTLTPFIGAEEACRVANGDGRRR